MARDRFWALIIQLSRQDGVTIFITTHFMNEAQRCDRISLMHAGRILASDAPAALMPPAARQPGGRLHRLPQRRQPAKPAGRRTRRRTGPGARRRTAGPACPPGALQPGTAPQLQRPRKATELRRDPSASPWRCSAR